LLSHLGDRHGTVSCRLESGFTDNESYCTYLWWFWPHTFVRVTFALRDPQLHAHIHRTASPRERNCQPCKLMCYLISC
jgi:hypothetical protein